MHCVTDPDVATFAAQVLPHLHRDPVHNSLACTLIEYRRSGQMPVEPDAAWLRVLDDHERLAMVAMRTPPHPLLLTGGPPEAVDTLVAHARASDPDLPMVSGPAELAGRFAAHWSAGNGRPATVAMHQRLFRLDQVTPPRPARGHARTAEPADRKLLIEWLAAFHEETHADTPHSDVPAHADRLLSRGDAAWLWERDGAPVSMVCTSVRVAGVTRIAPVYTPPARRGNGYATACVAATSQYALDQGTVACMLYTDQANPTSNKIYQAVGYYPVGEAAMWRLG